MVTHPYLIAMATLGVLWMPVVNGTERSRPDEANKVKGITVPTRGVSSSTPAQKWDYGFLTGNGRIGAVLYGQPTNETVVFNHERLYLPTPRPRLPDLGSTFPEYRRIIREKGYKAAGDFVRQRLKAEGYFSYHSDPFHLAFQLKLQVPEKGAVADYLRTTDFATGEVSVYWRNEDGGYVRRLFVSRTDHVAVLSVKRPDARPFGLTITPTPISHQFITSDLTVNQEWIIYKNDYKHGRGGYDNVTRLIVSRGKAQSDGKQIVVSDADEVLLLTSIEWQKERGDSAVEKHKERLLDLPADYKALLRPHVEKHAGIFNRVKLDLGGGDEHRLTAEELLKRAAESRYAKVPPALLEKLYDASRFYFICSAGETPPNLQGIWNGVFTAPWGGSYTLDTNVQLAVDSALSGNMAEGMDGFFRMFEAQIPEWRLNAKKLFNTRGVVAPICESPNTGLHLHIGVKNWHWEAWTAAAGWLASYFYDYYLFTGDRAFLAKRAVPLMKEIAFFYEDFLTEEDEKGYYIYRPSVSPETGSLTVSDNSAFDVAIAKELLTNLSAACEELKIESENVKKWRAMAKKLPPYQIGPDGDLAEWADGTFRHHYNHRHHSPFYPVFRSFEFSPERTPALWEAARVALKKKGAEWLRGRRANWAGIPFGRVFHAQCAAYLCQGELVDEILNNMTDRLYPSLHMSLGPNGRIFNFDGNGAYPDIVNRSLAFSLNGTLDLLRSVPPSWGQGRIQGILVRGQITIDHLQWNLKTGLVRLELTSGIAQEMTLRLPGAKSIDGLKVLEGAVKVDASPVGRNARTISLPAEEKAVLELSFSR